MRKHITLFLALIVIACVKVHSQTTEDPSRTIVKLHPQQFFDNTFLLSLEKFDKDFKNSMMYSLGLTAANNTPEQSGYKAEFQYRHFPMKFQSLKNNNTNSNNGGLYAALFISHSYNRRKEYVYDPFSGRADENNKRTVIAFVPGVLLGYQRTFFEKLYLDVFVGGGMRTAHISDSASFGEIYGNGIFDEDYRGVFPKIGFSIGLGL